MRVLLAFWLGWIPLVMGCGTSMLDSRTRGWVVVETANLHVRSNTREKKALELAAHYQRIHDAIAEHELPCGFDRMTAPVEVTLLSQDDRPSSYRPPPTTLLGLQPQVVVQSIDGRASVRAFTHELTHRLVALCFPTAPVWLHEGMAEFYETARLHADTLELGFPPFVFLPPTQWSGRVYNELGGESVMVLPDTRLPNVSELRAMGRHEFYAKDQGTLITHYAGAWALVHLLKQGDLSLSPKFIRYLEALHAGRDEPAAWAASFSTKEIEARCQAYLREDYYARVRSVEVAEPQDVAARPLSRGDTALVLAGLEDWTDKRGVKRAEAFIDFAEEESATRITAMLYRGALRYAQGDPDAAKRWFELALREDPTNPDALAAALLLVAAAPDRNPTDELTTLTEARLDTLIRRATSSHHYAVAAWWTTYARLDAGDGIALAARAIALDGGRYRAWLIMGDAAYLAGRWTEALDAYQAALALSRHVVDETRDRLEDRVAELRARLSK